MSIQLGETDVGRRTAYFGIYTLEGLYATGGSDTDYEGPAISSPTLEYQHNLDGWVSAAGTFVAPTGGNEAAYVFDPAEVDEGLSLGTIAVRVTKSGFRDQTVRVVFGNGPQPGEASTDNRRAYFALFTSDGYTVTDNASPQLLSGVPAYEKYLAPSALTAFLASCTLEYQHNDDGWIAATGTFAHHTRDEFSYTFSSTETADSLSRGSIAVRITSTGYREQIARLPFGESSSGTGATPTITAVRPTPGAPPSSTNGFQTTSDVVRLSVSDIGSTLEYVTVTARISGGDVPPSQEEVVYRGGVFRGRYVDSVASTAMGALILDIQRRGGWAGVTLALHVDAIDAGGGAASSTFLYDLPTTGTGATTPAVDLGQHVVNAINRLPEQFRAKQSSSS